MRLGEIKRVAFVFRGVVCLKCIIWARWLCGFDGTWDAYFTILRM